MYYYQNIFVAISTILPILALITVGLRFQARKTQRLSLNADDWVILAALVSIISLKLIMVSH